MGRIDHLRDWITNKQDQMFLKQAKYYNRGSRDITFKVGDQHVSSKLVKPFDGPYVIVKVRSPNVYEIASQDGSLKGRYHIFKLFRYIDPNDHGADEGAPLNPEAAAMLDRELLKIHLSDSEMEDTLEEKMDLRTGTGRKRTYQHDSDSEPNRKRIRNRSFSK